MGQRRGALSEFRSCTGYQPIEEFLYDLPVGTAKITSEIWQRVPCNNPHWAQVVPSLVFSMIAHWRGLGKKSCKQHFAYY